MGYWHLSRALCEIDTHMAVSVEIARLTMPEHKQI